MQLSDGSIAINNEGKIYFYYYDKNSKELEKKDELKIGRDIYEISEINNGYILIWASDKVFLYNLNNKEIILDKNY